MLFAKARWHNGQKAENRELFCELTDSAAIVDSEPVDVEADSSATVILGGPVHLDSADKVSLVCSVEESPVEEGSLKNPELTAIRVGTLHEQ